MNEKALRTLSRSFAEAAQRETVMRVLAEGIVPGNEAVFDQLVAPEYVLHSPLGDPDREGLQDFLSALRHALADFRMVRAQILLDDDYAATRTVISGRFVAAFPGPGGPLAPTGKLIEWSMITLLRFNPEDQIAEEWAQFDYLSLLRQLGMYVTAPSFHRLLQS